MREIKEGTYPEKNKTTCEKCGCEFQYFDTEIITEMTTLNEEAFLGGFGVYKYVICPTCNEECKISSEFIKHKSIFAEIKEWFQNLWSASRKEK